MAQYENIILQQYNDIQAVVARVLGKTASQATFGAAGDDYGYGQETASTSVPEGGTIVTAQQWQALTSDLLRCLYHQTGTNSSSLFISTENVNGVGVTSGFPYATTVLTTASITSAIDNTVTVASTTSMNIGMTIKFTTATSPAPVFGGIVFGQTYYIFNIINPVNPLDPKKIQISTLPPSSTVTALTLTSNSSPNIQVEAFGSKGQYILEKDRLTLYNYSIEAPGTNTANAEKNRLTSFDSSGTYNPSTNPSGSFTQMELVLKDTYIHSPTPWNGSFSKTFRFTWPGANAVERHKSARYFFNSGGSIRITPNYAPVTPNPGATTIDYTWATICSNIGTLTLKAKNTILSSGITNSATLTLFNFGNSGFYNLAINGVTTLVNSRAPSSVDYYNYLSVTVSCLYNGQGVLDMIVQYSDTYTQSVADGGSGWGIEEPNSGTATIIPAIFIANGVDINGNITVQLPEPVMTTPS